MQLLDEKLYKPIKETAQQMLKYLTCILLALFLSNNAQAQDHQKEWDGQNLTWNNFTERQNEYGSFELSYYLSYHTEKEKFGNTTVIRHKAKCHINEDLSWVDPAYKTDQNLRYNQVIFNIIETHRRQLQYELDRVSSNYEIESKFNAIFNSCRSDIEKLKQESNGGQNLKSLLFWEEKTAYTLTTHTQEDIPLYENRNFGCGLHAGLGSGYFTGTLGKHFSPTFNFMYGFDLAYKNSILYLNGTLGACKVRKDYTSTYKNWYQDQNASLAIIDLSYGYALVQTEKVKLCPFAGLGITELTGKNTDNTEDPLRIVDYNLIFGLNADYKVHTKLKLIPNSYIRGKEKVDTSIRARLYVTRANFYNKLEGYSINLTIGVCGFSNFIALL